MRVNYGRQQAYREHGTEPACATCTQFGAAPGPQVELEGTRWCPLKAWYTPPEGICTSYEREPGAD